MTMKITVAIQTVFFMFIFNQNDIPLRVNLQWYIWVPKLVN